MREDAESELGRFLHGRAVPATRGPIGQRRCLERGQVTLPRVDQDVQSRAADFHGLTCRERSRALWVMRRRGPCDVARSVDREVSFNAEPRFKIVWALTLILNKRIETCKSIEACAQKQKNIIGKQQLLNTVFYPEIGN